MSKRTPVRVADKATAVAAAAMAVAVTAAAALALASSLAASSPAAASPASVPAATSSTVSYNVTLLAQLDPYEFVSDCWGYTAPDGTELAIYGHFTGTSFVDATDPSNPVEVLNLAAPSISLRDIKTYQNYAYITCGGTGPGVGLQIVDLTDPLAPVHVTMYMGNGFDGAHYVWIDT